MSDGADRNGVAGPDGGRAEDVDALEILRASNAVDPAALPTVDGPQARALYEEIVHMPSDTHSATDPERTPSRFVPSPRRAVISGLALVALGVLAVVLLTPLGSGGAPIPVASDPDPEAGTVLGGGLASCAAEYSLDTLAERDFAFEGVITAATGDNVTFDVAEVFAGEVSDPVTLGGGLLLLGGGTVSTGESSLAVGDRVLVAGDDTFAWSCGFTQPFDPAVADQWRATFS